MTTTTHQWVDSVGTLLTENQAMLGRVTVIAVVAVVIYYGVERFGKKVLSSALRKRRTLVGHDPELTTDDEQRIETLSQVFSSITRLLVVLMAFTIMLSELGVNIGPILAGAGVAGIAIGFGAQSLVKDLVAGVFILVENQYVKGDVVEVAGKKGKVVDISLRRTVLRDFSGNEHHVPNGEISVASNFTKEWSNVNLDISVDYETDLEAATAVLNTVAEQMADDEQWGVFIRTQPTVLGVTQLADSAIVLKLHGKVDADMRWSVEREFRKRIAGALAAADISIPFPHMVNIHKDE